MVVFFGSRMYGKVDQCPGLFYVATEFFYLQFVPLAPVRSNLIIDGTETDQGASGRKIGLSGKSVLFAYLRTALVLGGIGFPIAAVVLAVQALEPKGSWLPSVVLAALSVLCWVMFPFSYKLSHASAARAVRLAEKAGIDPRIVAEYFLNRGVLPEPDEFEESAPPFAEPVDEPRTP